MEPKKYKKPLKNCKDCIRLSFIVNEKGEKQDFCPVYGDKYLSQCTKKKTKVSRG